MMLDDHTMHEICQRTALSYIISSYSEFAAHYVNNAIHRLQQNKAKLSISPWH